MTTQVHRGLEGVVVTESSLSRVDGDEGRLIYRGIPIEVLAEEASFEEVLHLLWSDELPDADTLASFETELTEHRSIAPTVESIIEELASGDDAPMAALRTATSALSSTDEAEFDPSNRADVLATGRRLTAKLPTIVATYDRLRNDQDPIPPRDDLGHAANFLYMLTGDEPDPVLVDTLDTALVLHADHGINASTFSAMVTASAFSDLYGAITSAIGTLAGPLHGGANQNVMEMLLTVDESDQDPAAWVRAELEADRRIPGFGHRVYQVKDPRAYILGEMSEALGEAAGDTRWYEYSVALEAAMEEETGIPPNVDFYSASTYYQMDIPLDLYTPIFAMSRIGGWVAHVIEQYEENRIMRPRAKYVGAENRDFVPLENR